MYKIRLETEINPEYKQLRPFVSDLIHIFDKDGETIYEGRNKLKAFRVGGVDLIVKSFKKPHIINKIAYSFFRESKAKRSYLYALDLLSRGVDTPAPIAYINEYKHGLLSRSYYVCIYRKEAVQIAPYVHGDIDNREVLEDMVRFIVSLHEKNVLHLDLSPGNVLIEKIGGKNYFSIIDINRLKIGGIDKNTALKNFARLSRNRAVSTAIAEIYAGCRGWNTSECVEVINKNSDDFFRFKTFSFARKEMKKYYGTFRAFCGPVQLYRLILLLRKLMPVPALKKRLYAYESDLYFKYIHYSDVRRVLMSDNHYAKSE